MYSYFFIYLSIIDKLSPLFIFIHYFRVKGIYIFIGIYKQILGGII